MFPQFCPVSSENVASHKHECDKRKAKSGEKKKKQVKANGDESIKVLKDNTSKLKKRKAKDMLGDVCSAHGRKKEERSGMFTKKSDWRILHS